MSDVAAYHVLFPVQGVMWTPPTSLHWKKRTHKYMICCHITH